MKTKRLFISLALGLGLALVLLWLLGAIARPARADPGTLCVAPGGNGCDPVVCGGICYASVQAAVDQAIEGDEILVASGVYTGVHQRDTITQVVYVSKTITIRGGYTITDWTTSDPVANPTTLDAQRQGRVLYVTGDPSASSGQAISPTIEGLRITGGDGGGWLDGGGGLYVVSATVTIINNQVFSNTSGVGSYGGGLCLVNSDATLNGNTFISNTAHGGGGLVVAFSAATLYGNTISHNVADGGGGLDLVASSVTLSGNVVISNTAYFWGGGLYLDQASSATLVNDVVADNRADSQGSGLYVRGSSPRLLHTTIARNSGGDGSGVYVTEYLGSYSTVALTNTIVVSHTVGITVTGGNTITVNGILWYGVPVTVSQAATATVTVQNQRQGNPAFATDGYHLTGASAAIDKGVDAGVTTDVDGQPRDAFPDLGADEYHKIYLPIILKSYP